MNNTMGSWANMKLIYSSISNYLLRVWKHHLTEQLDHIPNPPIPIYMKGRGKNVLMNYVPIHQFHAWSTSIIYYHMVWSLFNATEHIWASQTLQSEGKVFSLLCIVDPQGCTHLLAHVHLVQL